MNTEIRTNRSEQCRYRAIAHAPRYPEQRMKIRGFDKALRNLGFNKKKNSYGDPIYVRESTVKEHLARDSVRGSAWYLTLAVGEVPDYWPILNNTDMDRNEWIEAESPWFDYFTDLDPNDPEDEKFNDRETALQKCFEWLETEGLYWLENHKMKSIDRWRIDHNLLVKNRGISSQDRQ